MRARWLGAAEYLAFHLTGEMCTDYSLAGRTYAFRIDKKEWDQDLAQDLRLASDIFPECAAERTSDWRVLPSIFERKRGENLRLDLRIVDCPRFSLL